MSNVTLTTPSAALMRQVTLMSSEGGSCRETGSGINGEEAVEETLAFKSSF